MLAGAWEWAAFAGLNSATGRAGYVAVVAVTIAALWQVSGDGANLRAMLLLSMVWWLVGLLWLLFAARRGGRVAAALAGLAVLAPAAVGMARLVLIEPHGRALLLFLLVLTAAADVGAFFGGRRFGRRKLAPVVSPGKTWEGLATGMLAASLAAAGGAVLLGQATAPVARALRGRGARVGGRRPRREHVQAAYGSQGQRQLASGSRRRARSHRQPHRGGTDVHARIAEPRLGRMTGIAVLGSTGSIGVSTLDVVARHPDAFPGGYAGRALGSRPPACPVPHSPPARRDTRGRRRGAGAQPGASVRGARYTRCERLWGAGRCGARA